VRGEGGHAGLLAGAGDGVGAAPEAVGVIVAVQRIGFLHLVGLAVEPRVEIFERERHRRARRVGRAFRQQEFVARSLPEVRERPVCGRALEVHLPHLEPLGVFLRHGERRAVGDRVRDRRERHPPVRSRGEVRRTAAVVRHIRRERRLRRDEPPENRTPAFKKRHALCVERDGVQANLPHCDLHLRLALEARRRARALERERQRGLAGTVRLNQDGLQCGAGREGDGVALAAAHGDVAVPRHDVGRSVDGERVRAGHRDVVEDLEREGVGPRRDQPCPVPVRRQRGGVSGVHRPAQVDVGLEVEREHREAVDLIEGGRHRRDVPREARGTVVGRRAGREPGDGDHARAGQRPGRERDGRAVEGPEHGRQPGRALIDDGFGALGFPGGGGVVPRTVAAAAMVQPPEGLLFVVPMVDHPYAVGAAGIVAAVVRIVRGRSLSGMPRRPGAECGAAVRPRRRTARHRQREKRVGAVSRGDIAASGGWATSFVRRFAGQVAPPAREAVGGHMPPAVAAAVSRACGPAVGGGPRPCAGRRTG